MSAMAMIEGAVIGDNETFRLPGFEDFDAPVEVERGEAEPEPASGSGSAPERTLDQLLAGVWRELSGHRTASCPVCGAAMQPVYGVHALPIGGRCGDCGSELS